MNLICVNIQTMDLKTLAGPIHIGADHRLSQQQFQGVQFPAQVFFTELFVNERMAGSTDIDAPGAHLFPAEVFTEPLVAVTCTRNQVMKGNLLITATQLAQASITH